MSARTRAEDARWLARDEAACRAVGLGDAWDAACADDNPNTRMARSMIAAVALYVLEVRGEQAPGIPSEVAA